MQAPMNILLVEDDLKIAALVEKALTSSSFTVSTHHDGIAGLHAIRTEIFDAAIIDIMLPGIDGLQIIEEMRRTQITTPVLILSARQSVDDRILGLKYGGDDYMVKPFAMGELLARIEALIRRTRQNAPPVVLAIDDLKMDLLHHEVYRGEEKIDLPAKEFSLLELLMRNPNQILSKTYILEKVFDYTFDPQTNVVDVLVCRLRNHIDKDYERKLIHTVRGLGYVLRA